MDAETLHDSTISIVDGDIDSPVRESSIAKDLLMQMELDIACTCERMVNLNILMIHVAARASEIEALEIDNIEKEESPASSMEKLLELDFLYEMYESEVGEVGDIIATLQAEILNSREVISSVEHSDKSLSVILERFNDSEKSLKQSQEELLYLRTQSAKLRSILSSFRNEENWKEEKDTYKSEAKIKMQTSEQKRHILRMLEKSLATEMELEKKLMESKETEEELKSRLCCSSEELISVKEETISVFERLFESDCRAEVLKGISREQMGQLQLNQFNLKRAVQREAEMKSRMDEVEMKCKILEETNLKLNEEVEFMRNKSSFSGEIVESLKKQLHDADIQLQHASACVEASEEKQTMLFASINDMQTVIDGLKSKVLSAETQADNAEDKWIMLSESNAELTDELNLLRGRLECLEAAKSATAKDLNVRTKIIMDLVLRLAIEREHLHKKVSSIVKENKFLVESLQETKRDMSSGISENIGKCDEQKEVREGKNSISGEEREELKGEGMVRRIDAGQLRLKHLVMAIVVVFLSFFLFNYQN